MSEKIISERIIQMDWICRFCKHRNPGLSGEDEGMTCSNCGHAKDAEEYLMPDDTSTAPTVTDSHLLELANAGENWRCSSCSCEVRAAEDRCQNCGADRDGHKEEAPEPIKSMTPEIPPPPKLLRVPSHRHAHPSRDNLIWGGVTIGILCLTMTPLVLATIPHTTTATVSAVSWTYIERLDQRSVVHQSRWGQPGDGAFNTVCDKRQNGVAPCNPHDCNCHDVPYDCRCTGGDTYKCNPHKVPYDCRCTGGDTYKCNPHKVPYDCQCTGGGSYDCRCRNKETCVPQKNGSAKCTTRQTCDTCTSPRKCDTCYETKYDTCKRPKTCETCYETEYDTCTHPRVCDTCTKNVCDTCFDQCPVYNDWCEFDLYQWAQVRQEKTSGTDIHVRWFGLTARGEDQRVHRSEKYSFTLTSGAKHWTEEPKTLDEFQKFAPGKRYIVKYKRSGEYTIIGPAD